MKHKLEEKKKEACAQIGRDETQIGRDETQIGREEKRRSFNQVKCESDRVELVGHGFF